MINLHLMLIMLSFHAPQSQPKELPLVPAPQVVAPISLFEDEASLEQIKGVESKVKALKQRVGIPSNMVEQGLQQAWKPYIYFGADHRWHATWSETV